MSSLLPAQIAPETLAELLHRVFGHREFRAHQREVCEAAAAGRDVLLVMPTGAGKSLCYQLPALARGGTALVISPLIALMDDQAGKLSALGLRVARVHSGLSRDDARQACRDYLAGELDFLFIAPERMRVPGFPEMLAKRKPSLVAIDEAHCISAWGHDFRPDYRTLGSHLPALRPAPIIALTATATPTVQKDIAKQLDLKDPAVFITGFRRENLAVEAMELSKPQRAEFTAKLLAEPGARPAIVYAASRKSAEELAERLNRDFPARAYHAGLEPGVRERVQREFLTGKIDVVVATVAFGMGVDKADVRTVVHVALPGSVEAFYQEIGRAGRDGLPSRTMLLYSFADRKTQEFFLEKNYPPVSDLEQVAGVLGEEFVEPETLQRALGKKKIAMDKESLDRAIEKLQGVGVAEVDMAGGVRAGEGRRGLAAWKAGYDLQVEARRAQIDKMVAFAEGHQCRMTALVRHFGDTTDTRGPCGRCDVCRPQSASGAEGHAPDADECRDLRVILKALEGRGTSTGKLFTELKLTSDRKRFDALLDGLARAGLIVIANETFTNPEGQEITYRKATITHEGRSPDDATLATVWIRGEVDGTTERKKSKRSSPRSQVSKSRPGAPSSSVKRNHSQVGLPLHVQRAESQAKPSPTAQKTPLEPPIELSSAQTDLEAHLKKWRREEAGKAGLPSFFVFSDTVLRNIVLAAPQSIQELSTVRGVGPEKLGRFGAAVLEMCRA
jgi:ATP-dependent DNA helicase RecQ